MSLFEEAAKAWAEPDKEKGALPIEQDVARAYIEGRNAGRASESARLREKVEAMREEAEALLERDRRMGLSTERMGAKKAAFGAVLALLAEPGEDSSR